MANPSPYRSLPAAKRVELVTHLAKSSREMRELYIQRLVARGGGFRAVALRAWPVDRLAKEVVRTNAQSDQDELDLLHTLYVELEPAIQVTFLDAAGVPHENGRMPDELEVPYADADAVRRAALATRDAHGDDGMRYLRTLARYGRPGWPGIETVVEEFGG